jgi:transposase
MEATTMVVVGADVHKLSHTFVAVDEAGRKIGEKTVRAVTVGHAEAVMWVRERFGVDVVWAIEDCRHLSARLERDLLGFGQKVVRVPPKLMAQTRASARTRGKSDPIELKLLVDRREVLVAQRTATINRLRWRIHELDPERAPKSASLDLAKHRQILGQWLGTVDGLVAELARDELADITRLTEAINALATRIGARVRQIAPVLLAMPGCGELTAAKLVGETAGVSRFKSEAAFARHAGVAPVPVWSGNTAGRVRMTRSGNRQLNAALHRIAVTQIRFDGLGQTYYRHRLTHGDSTPEALRCLKRRLSRIVYSHLHTDEQNRQQICQPAAA